MGSKTYKNISHDVAHHRYDFLTFHMHICVTLGASDTLNRLDWKIIEDGLGGY